MAGGGAGNKNNIISPVYPPGKLGVCRSDYAARSVSLISLADLFAACYAYSCGFLPAFHNIGYKRFAGAASAPVIQAAEILVLI